MYIHTPIPIPMLYPHAQLGAHIYAKHGDIEYRVGLVKW
jgi:hypothetical protein